MQVLVKKLTRSALPLSLAILLYLYAAAAPLHAQNGIVNGCPNSPENPTALLALVGSAGAGTAMLRQRLRRKNK